MVERWMLRGLSVIEVLHEFISSLRWAVVLGFLKGARQ